MAIRFKAISASGEELEIFQLTNGLSAAIDPAHGDAKPFEGSDVFKTATGRDVHQSSPGVFEVAGSATAYQRMMEK